jgi:lactoylglutathione lyase
VKGDAPRPLNRLGLTHLSFLVEDLDATLGRLESLGGQVLPETRIEPGGGVAAVFLTDPDGTLVELVRQPQS